MSLIARYSEQSEERHPEWLMTNAHAFWQLALRPSVDLHSGKSFVKHPTALKEREAVEDRMRNYGTYLRCQLWARQALRFVRDQELGHQPGERPELHEACRSSFRLQMSHGLPNATVTLPIEELCGSINNVYVPVSASV